MPLAEIDTAPNILNCTGLPSAQEQIFSNIPHLWFNPKLREEKQGLFGQTPTNCQGRSEERAPKTYMELYGMKGQIFHKKESSSADGEVHHW